MTHVLTIPDQKTAAEAVRNVGCWSGQGDLISHLCRLSLARSERDASSPWKRMDHVHLSRAGETNYCQWWGRAGNGYHYPIGRIMEMVPVTNGEQK